MINYNQKINMPWWLEAFLDGLFFFIIIPYNIIEQHNRIEREKRRRKKLRINKYNETQIGMSYYINF